MHGDKLKLVKASLRFMVSQLGAADRFGLVVWDDDVETQFRIAAMDDDGKASALEAIGAVTTRGCTNLSSGLLQAIKVIQADTAHLPGPRTASVLLFTDGLANRGVQEQEQLVECMRGVSAPADPAAVPTVFTFGFGSDHNADMLRAVSDQGKGLYYFLENKEAIPQTFADCLGGLLSVVGQNLSVTIEALSGASLGQVFTKFSQTDHSDSAITLNLGDLYSEERRDLVATIDLPAESACDSCPLYAVRLKYFDTVNARSVQVETQLVLPRLKELPDDMSEDTEVAAQYGRCRAARAMEDANRLGKEGKFSEGQTLLRDTTALLRDTAGCEELQLDLQECMSGMQDRQSYETRGTYAMNNYSCSASNQRSCSMRSGRTVSHQTSKKAGMCKIAEESTKGWDDDDEDEDNHMRFGNAPYMNQTLCEPVSDLQPDVKRTQNMTQDIGDRKVANCNPCSLM
jgi:hypothetical protein